MAEQPQRKPEPASRQQSTNLTDATTATRDKGASAAASPSPEPGGATTTREPTSPSTSRASTSPDTESWRRLAQQLAAMSPDLSRDQPRLSQDLSELGRLATGNSRPVTFQHQLAYAVQDLQRAAIPTPSIPPAMRDELTRMARSAPGLVNERMADLIAGTRTMTDQNLVRDIRTAGAEIGRMRDQYSDAAVSRIEVVENRIRLARETPTATVSAGPGAQPSIPAPTPPPPSQAPTPAQQAAGSSLAPASGGASTASQPTAETQRLGSVLMQQSPFAGILNMFRKPDVEGPPPWQAAQTPLGPRIEQMNQRAVQERESRLVEHAEHSGRAALDALQAMRSTSSAAVVLGKIETAAKGDPRGLEGVVAEMREGGKHADLRRDFNSALATDRTMAANLDRAAQAVATYGRARTEADPALARAQNPAAVARIEELDASIGKAAGVIPGRQDGKSLIQELGELAARTVQRAIDTVRATFSTANRPDEAARASPSPSPA